MDGASEGQDQEGNWKKQGNREGIRRDMNKIKDHLRVSMETPENRNFLKYVNIKVI